MAMGMAMGMGTGADVGQQHSSGVIRQRAFVASLSVKPPSIHLEQLVDFTPCLCMLATLCI